MSSTELVVLREKMESIAGTTEVDSPSMSSPETRKRELTPQLEIERMHLPKTPLLDPDREVLDLGRTVLEQHLRQPHASLQPERVSIPRLRIS